MKHRQSWKPLIDTFVDEVVYDGQLGITEGDFTNQYPALHRAFWANAPNKPRTMLEHPEVLEYWNEMMHSVNEENKTLLLALMEDIDGPFGTGWPLVYLVIDKNEIRIIFSDTRETPTEVVLDEIWNGPLNEHILDTLVGRLDAAGYEAPDNPLNIGGRYLGGMESEDVAAVFDSSFLAYMVPLAGDPIGLISYQMTLLNWTQTDDLITVLQHTS
jgi:hypothetical protein